MGRERQWVLAGLLALAAALAGRSAAAQGAACYPACRTGYLCDNGTCVSACNPPCGSGEICTGAGDCINAEQQEHAKSIHRHDGFYVRLALGAGYLTGKRQYTIDYVAPAAWAQAVVHGTLSGFAQVGALMVGGTPASGLVIGGGGWGVNVFSPTYNGKAMRRVDGGLGSGSFTTKLASTSVIGPFVAYYPDPSKGLYGELGLGFGIAQCGDEADSNKFYLDSFTYYGWGGVLGVGYDFWIGEQWSLGAVARVTYVNTSDSSDKASRFTAFAPALAIAVTYH